MRLDDLRAKGAFVSAAPVRKDVEWRHFAEESNEVVTDAFAVHVRRHSFGTISRAIANGHDKASAATLIAESILLGDDASEAMTTEDALALDPGLAGAFIAAINEVNGLSERVRPKNSRPSKTSGTT